MESQKLESQEPKVATSSPLVPLMYSNRVVLKTILECGDDEIGLFGKTVVVGGWVKSSKEVKREPMAVPLKPPEASPGPKDVTCVEMVQSRIPFFKTIIRVFGGSISAQSVREKLEPSIPKPPPPSKFYLQINDGSCFKPHDSAIVPVSASQVLPTGTCILIQGVLEKPSTHGKQTIELKVEKVFHVGTVESDAYPLSRKKLPLDSLRDSSHIRPRTTTVASITRIRSALDFATHAFFQNHGFLQVQVPIITTTDSEGFSEKFQVTTLLGNTSKKGEPVTTLRPDYNEDFFGRQSYLTVSGRLHLESYACALGNVYSFGPRFRAEKTVSLKQVAEMWIVEVEMAFTQLEDSMKCAEDCFKFLCRWILDHCSQDMNFLADDHYKKPVIIYDFPKAVKPFYVRLNDDGKTVAAFDLVLPKIGRVITGSQSEERFDMLTTRIKDFDLPRDQYEWYQDLRRHGTVKHSGFSLGFDLMVLLTTGLTDVRDAIPFPRTHGKASN
ncbi:hypothetical protein V6N13_131743 [Hibiscus sabdariffa]|uniref:Aminoacyl-transfer RNA synthetases class-II family profile domain-containing protein n=1 Tax=Hibiscus sabdariffa TaxID=183260 RepID=A0ABR2D8T8_9ROSI